MGGKSSGPPANFANQPWAQNQTPPEMPPSERIKGTSDEQWAQQWRQQGGNGLDFFGAANYQGMENRPNQATPFASSTWTTGPDGRPMQSLGFTGGMQDAFNGLNGQIAGLGQAANFGSLPGVDMGADTRQRTEDALYGRATSRLDPQWNQREQAMRADLANQGLDMGSEAYRNAMSDFSRQRNDAYSSARNDAITGGGSEMARQFGMSMANRQNALAEMLQQRALPLQEMQRLQGFLAMPGVQAGSPWLQAAMAAGNYALGQANQQNQGAADFWKGIGSIGTGIGMAASDERVKFDVERHPMEAMPGVPVATFRYRNDPSRKWVGVIAQDVAKHYPDRVKDIGGVLHVAYQPQLLEEK